MSAPALRLGALELPSPWLLAPLESVSDAAFRRLCWTLGAGLTFTEMIRARGVAKNNASTLELIDVGPDEAPAGIQLMTTGPDELEAALERLEKLAATTHPHFKALRAVDLNFGCPSPEVIKIGGGPALLKRRKRLEAIFRVLHAYRRANSLQVGAVGAKLRLGLNAVERREKVYLPVADAANEWLDFLTVHARHARQKSAEPAEWAAIAEVKARSRIPIVGNGDALTAADARRMAQQTGCDAVLIARGAIRSPWIFRELEGGAPPTLEEVERAEAAYLAHAQRRGTKDKYLAWHREGFARMKARLRGQPLTGPEVPPNSHTVG